MKKPFALLASLLPACAVLLLAACQTTKPLTTADPVDTSRYESVKKTKDKPPLPAASEEEMLRKIERKEQTTSPFGSQSSTPLQKPTSPAPLSGAKPLPKSIPPLNAPGTAINQNSFLE